MARKRMTLLEEFCELVCLQLGARGKTRMWLAEQVGTSPAYLTRLLNGHSDTSVARLEEIATLLDIDVQIRAKPRRRKAG